MNSKRMRPLVALVLASCGSGSVTFDVRSEVPCESIAGTAVTVGLSGSLSSVTPKLVTACTPVDDRFDLGSFTVTPGKADAKAAIVVAMAVTSGLDPVADCTEAKGYRGCIVARRELAFAPGKKLTVPVDLFAACTHAGCDEASTCNKNGKCVADVIDPQSCDADNVCADFAGEDVNVLLSSFTVAGGAAATKTADVALTFGPTSTSFDRYCITVNDPVVEHCAWVTAKMLPTMFTLPAGEGPKDLSAWVAKGDKVSRRAVANTVVLDQTPPTANWVKPVGGEIFETPQPVQLLWAAADRLGLGPKPITLELSTDAMATWSVIGNGLPNAAYSWALPAQDAPSAVVRLTVADAAGNTTAVISPVFSLVNGRPYLASASLNQGALHTNQTTASATWGRTSSFVKYCINVNDADMAHCQWVTATTLPTMVSLNSATVTADGPRTLTIWLESSGGGHSEPVSTQTIDLDTTAPVVTSTTFSTGALLSAGQTRTITWQTVEANALAAMPITVEYSLDGATWSAIAGPLAATPASTDWLVPTLSSATVRVRVSATDIAGNVGVSVSPLFSVSALRWSPGSVDFQGVTLQTGSDQRELVLTNTGTTSTGGCAAPTVANSPDFQVVFDGCGTAPLTAGASCRVLVRATPSLMGPRTGTIRRTCTTGGAAEASLQVTGANTWPTRWSDSAVDLGLVRVAAASYTHTLAFQNVALAAVGPCSAPQLSNANDFSIVNDGCGTAGLASMEQCLVQVRATPRAAMSVTSTLSRTCDGETRSVTLAARGTAAFPISIAAGGATACAVLSDGSVTCWGDNSVGQVGDGTTNAALLPRLVTGISNARSVSVSVFEGDSHACAALLDGKVRCWGADRMGALGRGALVDGGIDPNPADVPGVTTATQVATDLHRSCALLADRTVRCWGQLAGLAADGGRFDSPSATVLPGATDVSELISGANSMAARLTDGGLLTWGGSTAAPNVFAEPTVLTGYATNATPALGPNFGCQAQSDSTVSCLGENALGQLGTGTTASSASLTSVAGLSNARAVVVGSGARSAQACAILNDGSLSCWGGNWWGQLGDGTLASRPVAALVPGLSGVTAAAMADAFTCALSNDHSVRCFGTGSLGDGSDETVRVASANALLTGVARASSSATHTCALMADHSVRCWGAQNRDGVSLFGNLGDGTGINRLNPGAVVGLTDAQQVVTSEGLSCATNAAGGVVCWGEGGRVGDGTAAARFAPTPVLNLSSVSTLAAGARHVCALQGGTVWCWGDNESGQLGNGSTASANAPVQVSGITTAVSISGGRSFSCAALGNGTVRCWGRNDQGQLGTGTAGSPVPAMALTFTSPAVAVVAGAAHACARLADGTVSCWGTGAVGSQTGTAPRSMRGVTQVATLIAGEGFSCAAGSSGSVTCWGANVGQRSVGRSALDADPTPVTGLGSVAAWPESNPGARTVCTVNSAQNLTCLGDNGQGRALTAVSPLRRVSGF